MNNQLLTDELACLHENRKVTLRDAERQLAMMDGAIQMIEYLLKYEEAGSDKTLSTVIKEET